MNKIIDFNAKERLLAKMTAYVESVELAMEETSEAVPLLCRGFKQAPLALKHKIILLLGSFATEEVTGFLYEIMADPAQSGEIRQAASVQLSVAASFLNSPQALIDKLINDISGVDPETKRLAAFALGWEGNTQAAIPLIELLYDSDSDVQQTAVNALANLRDDRILNLLLERLAHGPLDQQRTILYNLWRFYSRRDEVVAVYRQYLEHPDEDLRFDALLLLGPVAGVEECLAVYRRCLFDRSPRIRRLALESLLALTAAQLEGIRLDIEKLLSDPDREVKRLAVKCLYKISHGKSSDDAD